MGWAGTLGHRCWWLAVTGQAQLLVTGSGALLGAENRSETVCANPGREVSTVPRCHCLEQQ